MPLLLLLIHLETEAIEEGMEKEAKQERERVNFEGNLSITMRCTCEKEVFAFGN